MKIVIGLSVLIVVLGVFFASTNPDGLEKVAEQLGFASQGTTQKSIMTDYRIPFIPQEQLSIAAAGVAGVLIIAFFFWANVAINKKLRK